MDKLMTGLISIAKANNYTNVESVECKDLQYSIYALNDCNVRVLIGFGSSLINAINDAFDYLES